MPPHPWQVAGRWISGVHQRSDGPDLIRTELTSTVWCKISRPDPLPSPSLCRWAWSVSSTPGRWHSEPTCQPSLCAMPARSSTDVISAVPRRSDSWPRTPSCGSFAKEILSSRVIEPTVLRFYTHAPISYKHTPDLLDNHRFGLNFVFQTSKLVYFISFSYKLQIEWFNAKCS
jgi:hypothetical protein